MRRVRKLTFEELVRENKERLLKDRQALERLEEQWEERHTKAK
ncbi:FbpB family small basic protein [Halalkalibacter urbisdiaboli]|nr:FbpB family small basic protein [Halalkalibacter urbisdiaboli]